MAEQTGGLPLADIAKVNLYGMPESAQQELINANEAGLAALQQRYANPNWFNVAAGFFKPQLGGFGASLGSAAQALGENVEKQRANELPVAQVRAQLAVMKNQFSQNQRAADMERQRLSKGEPVTPDYVATLTNIAPDSPQAKAAAAQLATMQKQRELASSEQGNAMQRVPIPNNLSPTGYSDIYGNPINADGSTYTGDNTATTTGAGHWDYDADGNLVYVPD